MTTFKNLKQQDNKLFDNGDSFQRDNYFNLLQSEYEQIVRELENDGNKKLEMIIDLNGNDRDKIIIYTNLKNYSKQIKDFIEESVCDILFKESGRFYNVFSNKFKNNILNTKIIQSYISDNQRYVLLQV